MSDDEFARTFGRSEPEPLTLAERAIIACVTLFVVGVVAAIVWWVFG